MNQIDLIKKYFTLTAEQEEKFNKIGDLYTEWNEKINVISRKDIEHLYLRHVLHSLAIAKIITFKPETEIIDIGTGGGFPGIPLAIMFPEVKFTLVDSIGKKITVVNEVAKALELNNVTAIHSRAEKTGKKFDFVISRAVTAFPKFVALTKNLFNKQSFNELPNGIIYLKGGDFYGEIAQYKQKVKIFEISDFFEEDFFETKKIIYMRAKVK